MMRKNSKKLSTNANVAIVVESVLVVALLLLLYLRWPTQPSKPVTVACVVPVEAGTSSSKEDITGGYTEAERNKLVLFVLFEDFTFKVLFEFFSLGVLFLTKKKK
ncbi:hypothetical protein VIGAN_03172700 [Vigna angularis var. angularis]|uniref:Uncharacterized protein n=1 Tax=Vigna angularis var. angularis TaxID=157739 RepID=A0A0S3RML5_PHAAN|nr:hypothetical protein VIGAN_03172700 [Vigna angularis var. angularis]